ncbi:DeoR/GlpR family DNA-binding transcription regulator [Bifidobacterium oedipodis]|uniref:Lactose phosphotransferase system repressor n=1 Tax=Bifidobacterium oedipodis TaxID=2675322 RepID=A0A7Y0HSR9_9BIFI|nr:DeoR/GlpR family DNA-binding transcription regulator [Bifidobacterium sp. DSM 109957]NMM92899.1 DeoR family transcriptional regulator [Bifidobacterium sp. DSM 109957]
MMKAERQAQILRAIETNGRIVVTDYAKHIGVTEATLRKDLQELDDMGAVQRVHGGAIKPDTELARFENRVDVGADVKKRLAATAMDEICENRVVFIDGGSTNYLAAQTFPHDWEGTVITNSPAVALWMSDYNKVEVNMLPGTMNHKSKETVGSTALTAIKQLHCDLVLLGVSSIDAEHGITTPYLESAETKRAIISAGVKVMSLITPEKFKRISTYRIAGCDALDVIVTLGTPDCIDALTAMGIAVRSIN